MTVLFSDRVIVRAMGVMVGERAVVGEGGGGWEGFVLLRFCCSISFG